MICQWFAIFPLSTDIDDRGAKFDRWLSEHDRQVAERAWADGYEAGAEDQAECEGHRYRDTPEMRARGFDHWTHNPYRAAKGEQK